MGKDWMVSPGIGATAGGGPLEGTVSNFIIRRPDGARLSATFAGVGIAVGGPVSLTWSDSDTPGLPGRIVWARGMPPSEALLRQPNGFMLSAGTAPGELLAALGIPRNAGGLAGFSLMILGFGSSALPVEAAASVMLDIQYGYSKGWLMSGLWAYAAVVSAAKGVDVGGVAALPGAWVIL